jgi:hypothetical protein
MTVSLSAGAAYVQGVASSTQGVYHAILDASTTFSIALNSNANPRKDALYLCVYDSNYGETYPDTTIGTSTQLVVVQGTPISTAAHDRTSTGAPAAPAGCSYLLLAYLWQPGNTSSATNPGFGSGSTTQCYIVDMRVHAAANGGVVPFLGPSGTGNSIPTQLFPANPIPGQRCFDIVNDIMFMWDGTAWRHWEVGQFSLSFSGSGTSGAASLTPIYNFASAPSVFLTQTSTITSNTPIVIYPTAALGTSGSVSVKGYIASGGSATSTITGNYIFTDASTM